MRSAANAYLLLLAVQLLDGKAASSSSTLHDQGTVYSNPQHTECVSNAGPSLPIWVLGSAAALVAAASNGTTGGAGSNRVEGPWWALAVCLQSMAPSARSPSQA